MSGEPATEGLKPAKGGKRRDIFVSPVDLPASDADKAEAHPLRWTTTLVGTAALFLACFNATALVGWARDLPPGETSARIVAATEAWYDLTDDWGLTKPGETVRDAYDGIKAKRFGGEAKGQGGEP